jgi:predicted Zn-dependent protease
MKIARPLFPTIALTLLCAINLGSAWSADAPSAEEWAPVEAALTEQANDAEQRLVALIKTYPRWADGQRTLAEWRLEHGNAEQALADARAALEISPNDASAASLLVQALGKVGRPTEAFAVAEKFVGDKDPGGWVNFRAAEVAFNNGDRKKAELHLSFANGRAKTPPPEFAFLDARISEAAGDLDRAEISLNRAIAAKPRFWVGYYQLGVINFRQAETKTASSRIEYLKKSASNFSQVTDVNRKDALAWLGLGQAQLTLAQDLLTSDVNSGKAKAREAEGSLKNAVDTNNNLRDAQLNLGVALLINEKPESAITHLLRARELGATSRTINFNLMLAYQQLGRTAEFEAEAANVQAVSTAEKLTAGIGFFKAGNYALASELLNGSLAELGEDRERIAATYRFIGHAEAALADKATKQSPNDLAAINNYLDKAREAWRKAGNLRDYPAQRFFMAQETMRSPQQAYEAGWQQLRWHEFQSLDGWKIVTGNYGSAITGGQGIAGMWERHPMHLIIWFVLGVVPLCLALASWLRPKREDEVVSQRPQTAPVSRQSPTKAVAPATVVRPSPTSKPMGQPTIAPTKAPTKAPITAPANPQRMHAPPTRPAAAKSVPVPKQKSPKPQVRSQVETEPTLKALPDPERPKSTTRPPAPPSAKPIPLREPTSEMHRPKTALERKATEPANNAALERRTPRPDKR